MIDWGNMVVNALWIIGCALGLAAISHAYWEAAPRKEGFRTSLKRPKTQIAINLAGVLFSFGHGAAFRSTIETVLWFLITALFSAQIYGMIRTRKQH